MVCFDFYDGCISILGEVGISRDYSPLGVQ